MREFWIIREKGFSTWVSDKALYSADTTEEIHVREVNPSLDQAIEGMAAALEHYAGFSHYGIKEVAKEALEVYRAAKGEK